MNPAQHRIADARTSRYAPGAFDRTTNMLKTIAIEGSSGMLDFLFSFAYPAIRIYQDRRLTYDPDQMVIYAVFREGRRRLTTFVVIKELLGRASHRRLVVSDGVRPLK